MSEARRDQNRVTSIIGQDKDDNTTTTNLKINPGTGKVLTTQIVNAERVINLATTVPRDENRVPVACGVSTDDPTVIIPLPVTPEGYLLIE